MTVSLLPQVDRYPVILAKGAVIERIRRETSLQLDPHLLNTSLICRTAGRANPERVKQATLGEVRTVDHDAVRFLRDACHECDNRNSPVMVDGLMACRGDVYKPQEALDTPSAEALHRPQARNLATAGMNHVMAATLPALPEAIGLARALASLPVPYIISFIFQRCGSILGGTPLKVVIEQIDRQVDPGRPFTWSTASTRTRWSRDSVQRLRKGPIEKPPVGHPGQHMRQEPG